MGRGAYYAGLPRARRASDYNWKVIRGKGGKAPLSASHQEEKETPRDLWKKKSV